jgi:hypothetical protein
MSLKIDEILSAATQAGIPQDKLKVLKQELEELEKEKADDRAANKGGPKAKNKFVFLIRGTKELAAQVQSGWLVKIKDSDDTNTVIDRLKTAAKEQNVNSRKKGIINAWRDVFLGMKRKFSKAQNVQPLKDLVEVKVLETEFINE